MIHLVDEAIEAFLRSAVPLADGGIDVSFDAPDRTWGASVTRPTVNLFLWDVKRDPRYTDATIHERSVDDGSVERRRSSPAVSLLYFVTAWATTARDEHQLLGAVLQAFLANPVLPDAHAPEALRGDRTVTMSVAGGGDRKPGDFWSALDGRLKPGLEVQVGISVDVFPWIPAAPLTESIELGVAPVVPAPAPAADVPPAPAGAMRRTRRNGSILMEGRPEDGDDRTAAGD